MAADDVRKSSDAWTRRQIVQGALGASAAFAAAQTALGQAAEGINFGGVTPHIIAQPPEPEWLVGIEPVILFQGDSITDAGRSREAAADANSHAALGGGYAWLAAAQMLVDRPDAGLKILNCGISGNKVFQLAERWDAECLALKPNVLSILIGVNDFWHKHKHGYDGTVETYETDYRALLKRTRESLPKVQLVICEPFVLRVGAVDDSWFPEFDGYRAAAKKVAAEAGAIFVPFQSMFDEAAKVAPPETWAADGVHPTADGAALMAHAWLNAVGV
jgi:lysophospholipase L1-like esterase